MMGIGFTEMVLIAGIALVVIGPEKFPDFAKLVIRTIRDLKGYVDDVKLEVGKEFKPLKKELEALSRIDPEKYIDSLTAEATPATPAISPNMPVSPEDQKIMAEAQSYGEAQAEDATDDDSDSVADAVSEKAPEKTVGYGSDVNTTEETREETREELADDTSTPTTESETIDPDFADFDNRREPSGTGEPDVWTGR